MTDDELLSKTGGAWKVTIWDDGNFRRVRHVCYVRARSRELAEAIAIARFGGRIAMAWPWNPFDPCERIGNYVQ